MKGQDPRGTLECPEGFILDEKLGGCKPATPLTQAQVFKPDTKTERCITAVKESLRKKNPKSKDQDLKSSAIAICRSRLKK